MQYISSWSNKQVGDNMIRKHKVKVNHSKVLEVLSCIRSKALNDDVQELQTVLDQIVIPAEFEPLIKQIQNNPSLGYGFHEFLLHVEERQDVDTYFEAIKNLPVNKRFEAFLGFNCDEIEDPIFDGKGKVTQAFGNEIAKRTGVDFDQTCSLIEDFDTYLENYKNLAVYISKDEVFKACFTAQVQNDLDEMLEDMKRELAYRHPTSYAQSLMGKSFWNISDWDQHEFIPIYFNTPRSLRIFNTKANILLRGLYKRQVSSEALGRVLKEKLKLLSDPKRLAILRMTYMKPMYGKEIADALGLTTATVSHHLDLLRKAGLMNMEQEKHIKYFSTNSRAFDTLLEEMTSYVKE